MDLYNEKYITNENLPLSIMYMAFMLSWKGIKKEFFSMVVEDIEIEDMSLPKSNIVNFSLKT